MAPAHFRLPDIVQKLPPSLLVATNVRCGSLCRCTRAAAWLLRSAEASQPIKPAAFGSGVPASATPWGLRSDKHSPASSAAMRSAPRHQRKAPVPQSPRTRGIKRAWQTGSAIHGQEATIKQTALCLLYPTNCDARKTEEFLTKFMKS